MKKINMFLILLAFWTSVDGQAINEKSAFGSWINIDVADYYTSDEKQICDIKYFDKDEFIPLFLSFKSRDEIEINFRIEQKKVSYKVNYVNGVLTSISRGKNTYKVDLGIDFLKLRYNNHLVTFKRVSDSYTNDVFGSFIKGLIFREHKSYVIVRSINKDYKLKLITAQNFSENIRKIFRCSQYEFVLLGSFEYQGKCLPEIAIYRAKAKGESIPESLGILSEKTEIKFVDHANHTVLGLKSL
jgi:hypothetical protein